MIRLFRRDRGAALVDTLYGRIAAGARAPGLYAGLGVPDTLEGRFEALALHVVLVLRALRRLPPPAADIARDLTDTLFRELDLALREMGVGNSSVPKRMKALASAFFGRAAAYDGGLDGPDGEALASSLARNVLARQVPAHALARYVEEADRRLAAQDLEELLRDGPAFPAAAAFAAENSG